jgi:hypothetical protein
MPRDYIRIDVQDDEWRNRLSRSEGLNPPISSGQVLDLLNNRAHRIW